MVANVVETSLVYNSLPVSNLVIPNSSITPKPTDLSYDGYNRPEIHGSGEPNQPVYLLLEQNYIYSRTYVASATTDSAGAWSIQVPYELASGIYDAVAAQGSQIIIGDINPTFSNFSDVLEFTVASQLTPVITKVIDNSSNNSSAILNGAETNNTTPTIKGTAEPGSLIEIFDNGVKIGETQTGSAAYDPNTTPSWDWTFTPTQPLSTDQTHVFTAASRNLSLSNISMETTPSDYSYTIGIGVTPTQPAPLAPVITSVIDDVGTNQGAVTDGGQTNDLRPTLHGTSEPGTIVTVSNNGHVIGTATTGADWQWTFTPGADLTAGTNTLSVTAVRPDNAGGSTAAWYTHVLDVTPSLDAVLANAGLSAATPGVAPAAATPTVQAAYISPSAHVADTVHHDLAA